MRRLALVMILPLTAALAGCRTAQTGKELDTVWCGSVQHEVDGSPVVITKGPKGTIVSCRNSDGSWSHAVMAPGHAQAITEEEVRALR